MRIQTRSWNCGPIAILNSLKAIGIKATEKQISSYTGTTKASGTNQFGILSGLTGLNIPATEYNFQDQDEAYEFILQYIKEEGKSIILDFYKGAHWISLVGVIGDRVVVWDSDFGKKNKRENGSYTLDKDQLFKKWSPSEAGDYYLIVVNYDNKA